MIKKLVKQLWPYLKPYKKMAIASFLLSFVLAALAGAQVKLVKPIFDKGLSGDSSLNEVLTLAGLLLFVGILNFPTRYYHFYWMRFVGEKMNSDMRARLFAKLQRLPTSFYNQNKQGRMLSTILNDAEIFAQSFRAIVDIIREPVKALVYLGLAIYSDWQLTLVILVVGPLFVIIFQVSGKKVKANQSEVQEGRAELTHNLSEGLSAHKVTKAFNLQEFVMSRFIRSQNYYFDYTMRTSKVEEIAHPFVELVGAIAFSCVIVFAYFRIKSGAMTIGDFIQFVAALALLMDPIRKYSQANVKLGQGLAAADRINQILDLDEEVDRGTYEVKHFESEIVVKDVTFSYGEGEVLKNLSLSVKKGQKIALVGLSGSGKSTLINLLLGLYPIDNGSITIDGRKLSEIELKPLRKLFGLVSQDVFLFHDTIRSNLTIGGLFTDEQIRKALEVSYASEFVDKLPNGLETVIGDRGAKLSGGQQQRLTIARAFLQNTDILLFDEATSALDNESEKVVQRALEAIAGNKTVIAVAHRLSTVQDYDRIFVLKDGRLVEEGPHAELIAKNGEYKKLYELSLKA
ncbi:ABC transporter ATP-binding protein [Bacteriovorax sp. PP10]|uniref:ABC transporter ATP-binding protein n=1 Tax=Bacteriovorax antarcticus TaxID=3088717 RepID=A0ABU5VUN1_9BACT|nr:ABC transporter ATP-binding protein [Bacteriovorax sp. PP10]MEA9356770.1 ABC transporter ATP-binding protein [Bacteriovorax sp. PP10]